MSNCNFKTLHTDNGGDCTSREFNKYFKTLGFRHELTVPKTLEQNKVAERLNGTFMECVRAMLTDLNCLINSGLSHSLLWSSKEQKLLISCLWYETFSSMELK
uniref:Integrase catalytic domain-containing protein n=1 Tax=Amphimedon queenslandica TaxID=400682 RepID=A0A1X7T4V4_AMPQE